MGSSMKRITLMLLSLFAACMSFTTAAEAHAKLTAANPPADSVVAESPKELRLTFNEGLVAKFSSVEVKGLDGKKIETGGAAADPADKKQLIVPLSTPLADGKYSVDWQAVTDDTHRVKGSYAFTVKH